jgi:Fe-S-cluster-containing hydrogenase component 2
MPEPKVKITIDYKKCKPRKCNKGICAALQACPTKLIKQMEPYDYPYPTDGFCQECGKCSEACLFEAIKML